MSDGPHRSLPMRRHWKRVAERAANPNYVAAEVRDALVPALARDWSDEVPPNLVQGIDRVLGASPNLFSDETVRQLESLRPLAAGSSFGQLFLDCALQRANDGDGGADAPAAAAARALAVRAERCAFQVEEHYFRSAQASRAEDVRLRIDAGIVDAPLTQLAHQLLNPRSNPVVGVNTKRKDLDDGVPL